MCHKRIPRKVCSSDAHIPFFTCFGIVQLFQQAPESLLWLCIIIKISPISCKLLGLVCVQVPCTTVVTPNSQKVGTRHQNLQWVGFKDLHNWLSGVTALQWNIQPSSAAKRASPSIDRSSFHEAPAVCKPDEFAGNVLFLSCWRRNACTHL